MFYLHGHGSQRGRFAAYFVPGQLKAILLVRIVLDTIYFVSTQLLVRLKRLATMVTLKRTRRLISPDVSPDFRVGDSF
jgi:hypothetical protein